MKCSDCGRWRRVPSDAFVPARWVCADNDQDLKRYPSYTVSIPLLLMPINSKGNSALFVRVSNSETHLIMNVVVINCRLYALKSVLIRLCYDLGRAYCSAPQELSNFEIHQLLGISSDAGKYL